MAGVSGQGRKFSIADGLGAATRVFWNYGYEGSSVKMLTDAMGINPPSLYKAFGSKEELFFQVVDHYNDTHGNFMAIAFDEEHGGVELMRRLLLEAAQHYAQPGFPGGCLTISAAVTVTEQNQHVAQRLANMRNDNIKAMAEALDQDVERGRLPEGTDTRTLAGFVGTTLQGMSQQARDGATAEELERIAQLAIRALPEPAAIAAA